MDAADTTKFWAVNKSLAENFEKYYTSLSMSYLMEKGHGSLVSRTPRETTNLRIRHSSATELTKQTTQVHHPKKHEVVFVTVLQGRRLWMILKFWTKYKIKNTRWRNSPCFHTTHSSILLLPTVYPVVYPTVYPTVYSLIFVLLCAFIR